MTRPAIKLLTFHAPDGTTSTRIIEGVAHRPDRVPLDVADLAERLRADRGAASVTICDWQPS